MRQSYKRAISGFSRFRGSTPSAASRSQGFHGLLSSSFHPQDSLLSSDLPHSACRVVERCPRSTANASTGHGVVDARSVEAVRSASMGGGGIDARSVGAVGSVSTGDIAAYRPNWVPRAPSSPACCGRVVCPWSSWSGSVLLGCNCSDTVGVGVLCCSCEVVQLPRLGPVAMSGYRGSIMGREPSI